jgi:hypothetical protein
MMKSCLLGLNLFADLIRYLILTLRSKSSLASYYRKLWIDDVMKKAAYPSA